MKTIAVCYCAELSNALSNRISAFFDLRSRDISKRVVATYSADSSSSRRIKYHHSRRRRPRLHCTLKEHKLETSKKQNRILKITGNVRKCRENLKHRKTANAGPSHLHVTPFALTFDH